MTRRKSHSKKNHARRVEKQDAKFGSWKITWFVCCTMKHGKYSIARKHVALALDAVLQKHNPGNLSDEERIEAIITIFDKILKKVTPLVVVKTKRIGGANYQVPEQINELNGNRLAFKWIIKHSRKRSGRTYSEKLAGEFLDILEGRGGSINERETAHKMAQANLAFGGKSSYFEEETDKAS